MFWLTLILSALAQDPVPPSTSGEPAVDEPVSAHEVAALTAEIEVLTARLDALERQALLAEAEAMAASATPSATPVAPSSPSRFNPSLTAFGDFMTTVGFAEGELMHGSGPWLRSLELDVRADVDPFAKAVAVIAFEQEPPLGEAGHGDEAEEEAGGHSAFSVVPEEVYVDLVALPAGFSVRLGQFRQPFGVVNRAHPHDYPWPDSPLPLAALLGPEGYSDAGGVVSWRIPNPWGTGLTLQGGVSRGALLDPRDSLPAPQWIGRAEWFHAAGTVQLGLGVSGTGMYDEVVTGADLMFRWRGSSWRSVMVLVEAITDLDAKGGFAALQVQPTRPLYLGLRADLFEGEVQLGGFATYYTSEFLRLRGGVTATDEQVLAHAQLTFVWGSHPVEPYWVNR